MRLKRIMWNTEVTKAEIKYLKKLKQKKHRDEEQKFLIEGFHLIEECLASVLYRDSIERLLILSSNSHKPEVLKIIEKVGKVKATVIEEKVFDQISDTVNSQGIVAEVRMNPHEIDPDSFADENIIVALDRINDPGNLGTILRTCYWFDVKKILVSNGSADIFNPKTLRSSQGAVFHLNIRTNTNLSHKLISLKEKQFQIFLSDLNSRLTIDQIDNSTSRAAFVFGNEANGISKELLDDENFTKIKIKGYSECESLNVAAAAGIMLYEFRRGK